MKTLKQNKAIIRERLWAAYLAEIRRRAKAAQPAPNAERLEVGAR